MQTRLVMREIATGFLGNGDGGVVACAMIEKPFSFNLLIKNFPRQIDNS